jgi:hypothetical protein
MADGSLPSRTRRGLAPEVAAALEAAELSPAECASADGVFLLKVCAGLAMERGWDVARLQRAIHELRFVA